MPDLDGPATAVWPTHLQPGALRWVRSSTFYLTDDNALAQAIAPLLLAGIIPHPAPHPYWRANGAVVFLDPDGRGVVYAPWIFGQQPDPVDRNPRSTDTA